MLALFSNFTEKKHSEINNEPKSTQNEQSSAGYSIVAVYFAQTHVTTPEYIVPGVNENFKLISSREILIKVNITSPDKELSPEVTARLELNGSVQMITLTGPKNLPDAFDATIGKVLHQFEDSFTGIIPKDWVLPGLKVSIITPTKSVIYDKLTIGAPNKMIVTNFEINAYTEQNSEFPKGWDAEFAEKFPASDFIVQNVRKVLPTISVPPVGGNKIAARISNDADYAAINNGASVESTSENLVSTEWKSALRDAAGSFYGNMVYTHVAWKFEKRANKGVGGGYSSVGRRGPTSLGILLHEMGHGLSLPHWGNGYPYIGDMYGIKASTVAGGIHSGPIWSYDKKSGKFIPPYQSGVQPLTYKNDPMSGGGNKLKEPGFLTNHFSDYSVHKMNKMLESHLVVYNEELKQYAKWSNNSGSYSIIQQNTGNIKFPIERDVEVISVMAAVSSKTPQANLIYEPVGPYKSGIISTFDPRESTDKTDAAKYFCPKNGCDITLKIEQGGKIKYAMLPIGLDNSLSEFDPASFITKAVNLAARDGVVNKVELLSTPDAQINGLPNNPIVLDTWGQSVLSNLDFTKNDILIFLKDDRTISIKGIDKSKKNQIEIFDLNGRKVFSKNGLTDEQVIDLDISSVSKGIYIIHFKSENYKIVKKLIF